MGNITDYPIILFLLSFAVLSGSAHVGQAFFDEAGIWRIMSVKILMSFKGRP